MTINFQLTKSHLPSSPQIHNYSPQNDTQANDTVTAAAAAAAGHKVAGSNYRTPTGAVIR
mgnify:CR=1 FL=1